MKSEPRILMRGDPSTGLRQCLLIPGESVSGGVFGGIHHHDDFGGAAGSLARLQRFEARHQVRLVETGDDHDQAKVWVRRRLNLTLTECEPLEVKVKGHVAWLKTWDFAL